MYITLIQTVQDIFLIHWWKLQYRIKRKMTAVKFYKICSDVKMASSPGMSFLHQLPATMGSQLYSSGGQSWHLPTDQRPQRPLIPHPALQWWVIFLCNAKLVIKNANGIVFVFQRLCMKVSFADSKLGLRLTFWSFTGWLLFRPFGGLQFSNSDTAEIRNLLSWYTL